MTLDYGISWPLTPGAMSSSNGLIYAKSDTHAVQNSIVYNLNNLANEYISDAIYILFAPRRINQKSAYQVGAVLAIAGLLYAYDQEIMRKLAEMERNTSGGSGAPPVKNPQKAKAIKKRGEEPMRQALYRMSGVDLTSIDAIGVETVQVVISEYGPDLSCFPTEKHFVSHITLAPRTPKSGGKPLKKKKAR